MCKEVVGNDINSNVALNRQSVSIQTSRLSNSTARIKCKERRDKMKTYSDCTWYFLNGVLRERKKRDWFLYSFHFELKKKWRTHLI